MWNIKLIRNDDLSYNFVWKFNQCENIANLIILNLFKILNKFFFTFILILHWSLHWCYIFSQYFLSAFLYIHILHILYIKSWNTKTFIRFRRTSNTCLYVPNFLFLLPIQLKYNLERINMHLFIKISTTINN